MQVCNRLLTVGVEESTVCALECRTQRLWVVKVTLEELDTLVLQLCLLACSYCGSLLE